MRVSYDATGVVPEALKPYLVGERPRGDGEWDMYCPLHEDSTRSAQINIDQGVWYCHACEVGGTVRDLLRRKSEWVPRSTVASQPRSRRGSSDKNQKLEEADVQRYAQALLNNEAKLHEFQELRGIWRKTIVDYEIGWDAMSQTYTIPIRGARGKLLNIRRYNPRPHNGGRKIWSVAGYGSPNLYPIRTIRNRDALIICEGELDALITIQNGFPAVTRTSSAGTWLSEWSRYFRDKRVYICHDADRAGSKANEVVAKALDGVAQQVRIVQLPYPIEEKHGKDLTDWWQEHDGDRDAFIKMITTARQGKVVKLVQRNGKLLKKAKEPDKKVDAFEWTEDANARRFIEQHRGKLLYTPGAGWFRWSKQHYTHDVNDRRVWRSVPRELILKDVKRTARKLRQEAYQIEDHDDQINALKWARRSLSTAALKNVRDSVEGGDPHIADLTVALEELDYNPDILNTSNGIVDLTDGRLMKHDPKELCTQITNADYRPKADRSEWQKFLNRVVPDLQLQDQLQLCLGASITGRPTRAVFVLYGPEGENGKTQLIEAIAAVLGSYASSAMESTFVNASSREAGYDLARFRGVRFVSFSETREGHSLASERVKRVTGDDTVNARSPYGKPFSFRPQFSLWVGTNHAPFIPASERAVWKRVRVWPMFQTIPRNEQISDYGRLLARDHGSAILSWLVAGAQAFYLNDCRLGRPPRLMEEQRDEWQQRDDVIGRWIGDNTEPLDRGVVRMVDLWRDFEMWCDEQGEQRVFQTYTQRKFQEELDQNHPFPRGKSQNGYKTRVGLILNRMERS